jgi:hypothetical protein
MLRHGWSCKRRRHTTSGCQKGAHTQAHTCTQTHAHKHMHTSICTQGLPAASNAGQSPPRLVNARANTQQAPGARAGSGAEEAQLLRDAHPHALAPWGRAAGTTRHRHSQPAARWTGRPRWRPGRRSCHARCSRCSCGKCGWGGGGAGERVGEAVRVSPPSARANARARPRTCTRQKQRRPPTRTGRRRERGTAGQWTGQAKHRGGGVEGGGVRGGGWGRVGGAHLPRFILFRRVALNRCSVSGCSGQLMVTTSHTFPGRTPPHRHGQTQHEHALTNPCAAGTTREGSKYRPPCPLGHPGTGSRAVTRASVVGAGDSSARRPHTHKHTRDTL